MNEKIERAKAHFAENGKYYIGTGIGVIFGATAVLVLSRDQVVFVDSFKLINWKSSHVSQTILARRGHPGNVIKCNETGELFASQNRAAQMMGVSPANLSQHLSGKYKHAGGYTFTNLGEAQ